MEKGQSVERITKRIEQREEEKKNPGKQLAKEKRNQPGLQLPHILAFLDYLRELPVSSEVKRKSLINIFVNAVYLYDDYYTIIFNAGSATLKAENIPRKSIENILSKAVFYTFSGSDFNALVPPAACRRGQFVADFGTDFRSTARSLSSRLVSHAPSK